MASRVDDVTLAEHEACADSWAPPKLQKPLQVRNSNPCPNLKSTFDPSTAFTKNCVTSGTCLLHRCRRAFLQVAVAFQVNLSILLVGLPWSEIVRSKNVSHLPLAGVAAGEAVSNAWLLSALSLSSLRAKSLLYSAEATGGMRHAVTNWSLGRSVSAPCDYSGQSPLRMVKTERAPAACTCLPNLLGKAPPAPRESLQKQSQRPSQRPSRRSSQKPQT